MKTTLQIEGMSCGHCVNAVSNILKEVDGVEYVNVSLPDNAEVEFNESKISVEALKQIINDSEIYKAK
ncbi:MAG: heavy-metal-associated domain-containing protein [Flavobacteriales bacterium]|nr:heavy-metal-associated domain-containing protein [Flavobacteriales bacterium]